MAFKNFRQFALAAVVLVGGSVSAIADSQYEDIWDWNSNNTRNFTSTVSNTSGAGNTKGTEIKGTTAVTGSYVGSLDTSAGSPYAGFANITNAFVTFDLRSTAAAVNGPNGSFNQDFTGSFTLSSAANGGGTVYLTSSIISTTLATKAAATGTITTGVSTVVVSDYTGYLVSPNAYMSAFGLSFNFQNAANITKDTSLGIATLKFNGAGISSGQTAGTTVPEPSTLSLLGLGAAGLAFGAYRRRKAVAAV